MPRGLRIPSTLDLTGVRAGFKKVREEGGAAGKMTASEFLKANQAEFNRQKGNIKEAQKRTLMTPEEAKKRGNEVAREFNAGILARLRELRAAGQQNTAEFTRLQKSLKAVSSTSFRPVQGGLDRLITSTRLWVAALATGAVYALQRVLRSTFSDLRAFDKALTESLAIMGDVPEHLQRQMAETARTISRDLNISATEAGKAFFYLASAGLDAEQSIAAFPTVAAFAKAGAFDLARATDLVTDAQSALGLASKDAQENLRGMQRVSDVLVKANTLANASVEQFSESLTNRAAAALRILNKDVEEGVAVLAAYADQGRKGAEAGTALDIVLRDLQTRALENGAAFKRAGIEVFDASGKMRNIADVLADIERALGGLSDAEKRATITALGFSDRSVSSLLTLVGTSDKIREYERALRDAAGTTESVAAKQMKSIDDRLGKISQNLKDAGRGFAQIVLLPVAEFFGDVAGALVNTQTPLERTIQQLKGVNAEMSAFLQSRQNIALLREEIEKLRDKTPKQIGPIAENPINFTGSLPLTNLSDIELLRRRRQEIELQTLASKKQNDEEARLRQLTIDRIDAEIQRRSDLKAATEALQKAEEARNKAVERLEISSRIREINAEIAAVEKEDMAFNRQIELLETLKKRRADLQASLQTGPTGTPPAPPEDDTGGTGVDPDKATAAAAAAERLGKALAQIRAEREAAAKLGVDEVPDSLAKRLKEIVDLEARLNDLRAQRATAGALAAPDSDALIAGEQRRLDALKDSFAALTTDLQDKLAAIPAAVVESTVPAVKALANVGRTAATSIIEELSAVQDAQKELDQALRTGDEERTRRAVANLQKRKDALRAAAADAAKGLEAAGFPAERLDSLLASIDAALKAAGIDAKDLGADLSGGFDEAARSVELLARGLISALDAMGKLGDSARQVLTGVVDLAAGIGQLQKASGTLATLGAVGAIAGAAIGIGSAIFGGGRNEEEERARQEAARKQREEIERLTESLRKLGDEVGPFTRAVQQARDALAAIGRAAGGPETPEALAARRGGLQRQAGIIQEELVNARDVDEIRRLQAELAVVNRDIEKLNGLLEDYDAAIRKIEASILDDLDLRELAIAGTQAQVDVEKLRIAQEAELKDAIEAGVSDEVIARIKEVQALERQAAEEKRAAAQAQLQQDAEIRRLQAAGFSETAAITQLLNEQEARLAQLRKDGADAATLAAEAEAQLAEQQRAAADLIDSILRKHAERTGDTETLRQLDEADLYTKAADDIAALQKLLDAGLIDQDKFDELVGIIGEDLAYAVAHLGDAAAEAAQQMADAADAFTDDVTDAWLRGQGKVDEADRRLAQKRHDDRIQQAKDLGILDDALQQMIDDILASDLAAIDAGGAGGGSSAVAAASASSTEVTRSVTSISEVTAQSVGTYMHRLATTGIRLDEERNSYLRQLLHGPALAGQVPGYMASLPGFRAGRESRSGNSLNIGPVDVETGDLVLQNAGGTVTADALAALLTGRVLRQIAPGLNAEIRRLLEADARSLGIARRNP